MRSFGFCFGIVWCWRSTSCFRLLASLPYMSIDAAVIVSMDRKASCLPAGASEPVELEVSDYMIIKIWS